MCHPIAFPWLYIFALSTDIGKVFLHVKLHKSDSRNFTQYLWPEIPDKFDSSFEVYHFKVVSFGSSSSSSFYVWRSILSYITFTWVSFNLMLLEIWRKTSMLTISGCQHWNGDLKLLYGSQRNYGSSQNLIGHGLQLPVSGSESMKHHLWTLYAYIIWYNHTIEV